MKKIKSKLLTPIYLKTGPDQELPEEPMAYVLSASGLYLCRKNRHFTSCVPAPCWPRELQSHSASLALHYPKISRDQFELIVGFFARVAAQDNAEAAVLLYFDQRTAKIRLFAPRQQATVSRGWSGKNFPIDLKYDLPVRIDPALSLIGDVHSHASEPAYASMKDKLDETHVPGLHLVVGRIGEEPPDLYCDVVIDGFRFAANPWAVIEGYQKRCEDVPRVWLRRVAVEAFKGYSGGGGNWQKGGGGQDYGYGYGQDRGGGASHDKYSRRRDRDREEDEHDGH